LDDIPVICLASSSCIRNVTLADATVRQLRNLDHAAGRLFQAAVELLATEPRPAGAKKLTGGAGEWRFSTGDFRVIYEHP
jgi:mRNA interferase RelE/StbE